MNKSKQRPPALGDIERGMYSKEELAPYQAEFEKTREIMQRAVNDVNQSIQNTLQQSVSEMNKSFQDSLRRILKELDTDLSLLRQAFADNAPHVAAFGVLSDAIEEAILKPEMEHSPEVVAIARKFIELINVHPGFRHDLDAVFEPVISPAIKAHTTETHRRAGSASKKPSGKGRALIYWKEWANNSKLYKNKTAFCKHLVSEKCCDTEKTAAKWIDEFRTSNPCATLEKILPQKNSSSVLMPSSSTLLLFF